MNDYPPNLFLVFLLFPIVFCQLSDVRRDPPCRERRSFETGFDRSRIIFLVLPKQGSQMSMV